MLRCGNEAHQDPLEGEHGIGRNAATFEKMEWGT